MSGEAKPDKPMASASIKECFIIMPVTTPEEYISTYNGDAEHFKHVLECLFVPAIEKAHLKPIPPIAKGAELIQGKIIKDIEKSDLVLCDISSLNPNVFFELGIRTALNKPLCFVKDDKTSKIPFDTQVINHWEYKGSLHPWELQNEIEGLAKHISETINSSGSGNDLWKYFAISSIASPFQKGIGIDDQVAFLIQSVESLRHELKNERTAASRQFAIDNFVASNLFKDFMPKSSAEYPVSNKLAADMIGITVHIFREKDFNDLARMVQITASSAGANIRLTKDDVNKTIIIESLETPPPESISKPIFDLLQDFCRKYKYEAIYSGWHIG